MVSPHNLHKILIAVEDSSYSDIACNYGFLLAEKFNAAVALVHVNDVLATATPHITDPMLSEPMIMVPEAMTIQEEASKKLFERLSQNRGNTAIYTFIKIGNPRDEILTTAEEWNADMIILGTHGRTGFDHFISGSVAEGVARKAKCPVLIIPKGE
jgi:nucleotide-binding universal stress UspA family protein